MLKELTKGESQNLFTGQEGDQEVAVLVQGMIIGIGITGGEAVVGVGVDMSVCAIVRIGIVCLAVVGAKAGATVAVLVIAKTLEEAEVLLHGGVAVLGGAHLHANHLLQGVRVHTITIPRKDQPPQRVSLLVACKLIPVARHLTEANDRRSLCCLMELDLIPCILRYFLPRSLNVVYTFSIRISSIFLFYIIFRLRCRLAMVCDHKYCLISFIMPFVASLKFHSLVSLLLIMFLLLNLAWIVDRCTHLCTLLAFYSCARETLLIDEMMHQLLMLNFR